METYVVRIYRRGEAGSKELVGLVEAVGDERHRAFNTLDELVEILSSAGPRRAERRRHRRREPAPPHRPPDKRG